MGETQDQKANSTEFLTRLGVVLSEKEGVDSGLADILKAHILIAAPAKNCVAAARADVTALAKRRAMSPSAGD